MNGRACAAAAVLLGVLTVTMPGGPVEAEAEPLVGSAAITAGMDIRADMVSEASPSVLHAAVQAGATVLDVRPGGPGIAATLAVAPDGARIVIHAGTYAEGGLIIERPVELVGEGWPVLDGGGDRTIITVRADSVRISGLVLRNVATSYVEDRAAIRFEDARDCVVAGNRIDAAFFGIYLARTRDCVIADNVITGEAATESAAGNGVHLWYSRDVRIERNRIRGHRDGIYLEFVQDTEVAENISEHNLRYGLHYMFSDRCAYQDNVFARNAAGVAVMYSRDVRMTGNDFRLNRGRAAYALLLKDITDSEVVNNRFSDNSVALYVEGSNRVRVERNRFERNAFAIRIMANSVDNVFTGNAFVGNSFDVTTNSRASFSTFVGNYWDAYRGYDLDRDGTGDVPFRPVRLFSLLVERNPPALLLQRSLVVTMLDAVERAVPTITPQTLADERPLMRSPP
jgi:nitrous oxidase accessory protein